MLHPVTVCEKPGNNDYPEEYTDWKWEPIHMKDFKALKEAIVSDDMHSAYIREILNTWSSRRNRITPNNWNKLISAILEYGSLLQ